MTAEQAVIGRLLRAKDFERVLGTRSRLTSVHFAVHHLAGMPGRNRPPADSAPVELSTAPVPAQATFVDNSVEKLCIATAPASPVGVWLGMVVPKRHARRAVTRSLLKRQMREATAARASTLPPGIWVLRLRAPFDRTQFPSAASDALKRVARGELARLLTDAAASVRDTAQSTGRSR